MERPKIPFVKYIEKQPQKTELFKVSLGQINNNLLSIHQAVSPVQLIITDYKMRFPKRSHPTTTDLLVWLYSRAQDAELSLDFFEKENAKLETELNILRGSSMGI